MLLGKAVDGMRLIWQFLIRGGRQTWARQIDFDSDVSDPNAFPTFFMLAAYPEHL